MAQQLSRRKDFTGQQFGRWTVLERGEKLKNLAVWTCKCSCGSIRDIPQPNLVSGQSQGCLGCYVQYRTVAKGETHPQAKLTNAEVFAIRSLEGEASYKEIAARFGVSVPTVAAIITERTWRHLL